MKLLHAPVLALPAFLLASCVTFRDAIEDRVPPTTTRVLRKPDSMELLLLDPRPIDSRPIEERDVAPERRFHGHEILAHAPLDDEHRRLALVESLFARVLLAHADGSQVFAPRWGIRAVKEGKVADVLCSHPDGLVEFHTIDRKTIAPLPVSAQRAAEVERVLATAGLELHAKP